MSKLVPPEGPLTATIAFIGEAPGAMEANAGRPFIGPSGELFNRLLHSSGLLRSSVYITNVIKEQLPGNDITKFLKASPKGKVTTTPAYDIYESTLYIELASLPNLNVIVPLGNTALYAVARLYGIDKWRGSILSRVLSPDSLIGRQYKIIPTNHPAAALREYYRSYIIAIDMQRIAKESLFPDILLPTRQLVIAPSYQEVIEYLTAAQAHRIISIDIETSNNQVHCLSLAVTTDLSMSIPFMDESGQDYYNPEEETTIWRCLAQILESPEIVKVFHNALFDVPFILARYGIRTWPLEDTMIGQGLLAPDMKKGLGFITSLYTREPYYKDDGKRYMKTGTGRLDDFWRYNAKDAAVTLECLSAIKEQLVSQGNLEAYNRRMETVHPILYMQQHGIATTTDALRLASEDSGKRIATLTKELLSLTGPDFNYASFPQMTKYFYETKGYDPYLNRKTHKPTCDEKALARLRNKGSKEAALILQIRKLAKMKSTYLDIKLDPDSHLRTSFGFRTKTGRLSSTQVEREIGGKQGGNQQNLPTEFKRYLMADTGYILYEKDLSQAENRIVAYCGPVPNMITAFETGLDLHIHTTCLVDSLDYQDMLSRYKAEGNNDSATAHLQRHRGKQANHALNYDMGYVKASLLWGLPQKDTKFIVERYHIAYPEVRQRYQARIRESLLKTRTVTNPIGTKRKFFSLISDDLYREAYSHFAQSTVGDKINRDGLCFIYKNQDLFYAVELLNQVHDSIVFQIPLALPWEYHAACLIAIDNSLSSPIIYNGRSFSIPSDTKMGLNMADKVKVAGKTIDILTQSLDKAYYKLTKETP